MAPKVRLISADSIQGAALHRYKPMEASDARLYIHLVRLAVLLHALKPGAKAIGPPRGSSSVVTLDKLPKGSLKALISKLGGLASEPSSTSEEETFHRRVSLAFYAWLLDCKQQDPATYDEIGRRTELLVARFAGCVSKELQNFPNMGPAPEVVSQEGRRFIDELRQVVSGLKGGPIIDSQLKALADSQFDQSTAISRKMELSDEICRVCAVSKQTFQRDASSTPTGAVVAGVRRDMQSIHTSLDTQASHPAYSNGSWEASAWPSFANAERGELKRLLGAVAGQGSSGVPLEVIPPSPRAYFALIVRRILEAGYSENDSSQLLRATIEWWRVPPSAAASVLTEAACDLVEDVNFQAELISVLKFLTTLSYPGNDPDTGNREKALGDIRQNIVYSMISALKKLFEPKPPKLGPLLEPLDLVAGILGVPAVGPSQVKQLRQAILTASEAEYDRLLAQIPRDSSLDVMHIVDLAQKLISGIERLQKRYRKPLLGSLAIAKIVCARQLRLFGTDFLPMYKHTVHIHEVRDDQPAFEDMVALHELLYEMQELWLQVQDQAGSGDVGFGFDIEGTLYPYFEKWAKTSIALARSWVEPAIAQDDWQLIPEADKTRHSSSVADLFSSFYATLKLIERLRWNNQYDMARLLTRLIDGVSGAVCDYAGRLHLLFLAELRSEMPAKVNPEATLGHQQLGDRSAWLTLAAAKARQTMEAATGQFRAPPPPETRLSTVACVQLNDVAAAYTFTNRMEESVSADAVANRIEIEERRRGNKPAMLSYLFTVTVISARNLRTWGGGSYVTLVDQDSRKRLGKTRTVLSGNDPTWNQTFELEVHQGLPRLLKATVWDENVAANHELSGRALLKLDPKEFMNGSRRDYGGHMQRLNLDTQGTLLVQVTMDLRKDDIRFYFGQALRYLRRTQEDMVSTIVSQFDGYIQVIISLQTLRALLPSRASASLQTLGSWLGNTNNVAEEFTPERIEDGLQPLFDFLNANFSTLATILTDELRLEVMGRAWDCVLEKLELLILAPLDSRKTSQVQLTTREMEAVYQWLSALRDFFHNNGAGPDLERLQSQSYQQIMAIPVYYDLPTPQLRTEVEKLTRQGLRTYTVNAEMMMRQSTVMAHRSRSVIEKQAADLRRAQRAAPRLDDVILRILRMRGETAVVEEHLRMRERLLQKESTERALQGLSLI